MCSMHMQFLKSPEEGTGFPNPGVKGGFGQPCAQKCWDLNPIPPQEQAALLTIETSLWSVVSQGCWGLNSDLRALAADALTLDLRSF